MTRTIVVAALACTLSACSGGSAPASGPADHGQAATPAPATSAPNAAATAEREAAETPAGPPAASAPPAAPAAPAAPPPPAFRTVTIPSGTALSIELLGPVGSDSSQPEDRVTGELAKPIVVSGETVVPAGAEVSGTVLRVERSGRVKGRASIALRFNRLAIKGESHAIRTAEVSFEADADTRGDVKKGGIGAGAGAVVGGIAGGGKGAAIGGIAGGTAAVLGTRGKEVQLPAGSAVLTELTGAITLELPIARK